MYVTDYIVTRYFDAQLFTAMTQLPVSIFHDTLGRRRYNAAGAWENRGRHNGGNGMQTTFTVGDDGDTKWIRVREEVD